MLKLGNTAINKLYLGATEIKKAYLGSVLVFDNTAVAPIAYYPLALNSNEIIGITSGIDGVDTAMSYDGTEATFNGSTSFIEIPDNDIFSFTDGINDIPFSIEFNVNLNSVVGGVWFVGKNGASDSEWELYYNNNKLFFVLFGQNNFVNTIVILYDFSFPLNTDTKISGTYTGSGLVSGMKLYVNDVNVGVEASAGNYTGMYNTTLPVTVGKQGYANSGYIDGTMKNLKFIQPENYGDLYNKNSWTDVSDFRLNGDATAVISGDKINIGTTTNGVYDNYISLLDPTGISKFNIKLTIKLINSPVATDFGIGLGMKSLNNTHPLETNISLNLSNGAGAGRQYVSYNEGVGYSILDSNASGLVYSQNDIIELNVDFNIDTFTGTFTNITTGLTKTINYVYTLPLSPFPSNTGEFALIILGGEYEMQSLQISTKLPKKINLICVGDSKTSGFSGDSFYTSFANQLNTFDIPVSYNSGGKDRTEQVLLKIPELILLNPSKVLLNIGSNDKRFGEIFTTWRDNYDSITTQLEAGGINVYHLLQLNETVLDFTDYNSHITTTYPASRIVDAGTITLSGDGVHPNQTGMDEIYNAIVTQIGTELT